MIFCCTTIKIESLFTKECVNRIFLHFRQAIRNVIYSRCYALFYKLYSLVQICHNNSYKILDYSFLGSNTFLFLCLYAYISASTLLTLFDTINNCINILILDNNTANSILSCLSLLNILMVN